MAVGLDRREGAWNLGLSALERRAFAVVLGFNLALALALAVLKLAGGMDLNVLVRDVVFIADLPPYAGAYQFVSILFYAAGAAVALFAVAAHPGGGEPVRGLLAVGGGYAAFACLDDLYTLHEHGLYIGLPERGVFAIHAALFAWLALRAWRLGARTPWPILAGSLGAAVVAALLDLPGYHFPAQVPSEEILETLGAALLATYLVLTAYRLLAPRLKGPALTAGQGQRLS